MRLRKIDWLAGATLLALIGTVGYGVIARGVKQPEVSSGVVMAGTTLADGYLQPVNRAWWTKVAGFSVMNVQGQRVSIPNSRPLLFFAWWCPHCHAALKELARTGELSRVTLISTYLNAGQIDGKAVAIRTFQDAKRVTAKSLAALHLHVPASHLFYLMPGTAQNALAIGVPDFIEHTKLGWYTMNGTPSDDAIWPLLFHDEVNR